MINYEHKLGSFPDQKIDLSTSLHIYDFVGVIGIQVRLVIFDFSEEEQVLEGPLVHVIQAAFVTVGEIELGLHGQVAERAGDAVQFAGFGTIGDRFASRRVSKAQSRRIRQMDATSSSIASGSTPSAGSSLERY